MFRNVEELNLTGYSDTSINNIKIAKKTNLDAIGLLLTEKYNPNEVISFLQTFACKDFIGDLRSVDGWKNFNSSRVRGVVDSIAPLKDGKYSAHAMISLPTCADGILFPLLTNFASKTIYKSDEQSCKRLEKLKELFQEKLGTTFTFQSVSSDEKYYSKITKAFSKAIKGYEIYSKSSNSNYILNDYDKIVVMANIVATSMLNENEVVKNLCKNLNKEKISKIMNVSNSILTLAIMRATDIGNPEVSYKIDEALKLQIANDLALIRTYGNDVTKMVAKITKEVAKNIDKKLNFDIERIKTNMEAMGFKYTKYPRNSIEAIFGASNLEQTYDLEVKSVSKPKRAFHALTGAVLQAGITNLKQELPGIIDSFILTNKAKEKMVGKNGIVSPAQSLFIILKNKKKLNLFTPVIFNYETMKAKAVNGVIDRFVEQREEDFGKSYKRRLNDVLNEQYPSKNGVKSRSGTIVRRNIKESIKAENIKAKEKGNEL